MYNNPAFDTTRMTLGPGIIYIGPAGSTPTVDIGAVKGKATLTIERQEVEVRQGTPQLLVAKFAKQEDATLEITGIEWNLDRLAQVMMDGTTSLSGAIEKLKVGGRPTATPWALRFVHKAADGGTVEVDMWKVLGDSKIAIGINDNDMHDFPYKFTCMHPGATDWSGAALSDGQALVQILRTKA
jgi:hypothetical protein